jgi:hypothetical protein
VLGSVDGDEHNDSDGCQCHDALREFLHYNSLSC